jgi:UDP-N-acetylglucosamine enolpyruvyl transferase
MSTYGIDIDANLAYSQLLSATPIAVDPLDLTSNVYNIPSDINSAAYAEIKRLANADYTTGAIDGTGTFDVMMQGVKAQLKEEFDKGRITAAEYTKTYVALVQVVMQNATQFLLGRDQAYWQAVNAQIAAVTARVNLEMVKYQALTARIQAETAKADLALTKAKIGTEDAQYGQLKYNIDNLMPVQLQVAQNQVKLVGEQVEVQRAQTLDTRTDNYPVVGVLGQQKALYAQQIVSYKRDSEQKAAKIFSDAWVTQKTIDEGLTAPNSFTNAVVDEVMNALKNNNGL